MNKVPLNVSLTLCDMSVILYEAMDSAMEAIWTTC